MRIITRLHIALADWRLRKKQRKLYVQMQAVGRNVHICPGWNISSAAKMSLGSHVWIGENFYARAEGSVSIGSGTIISRNVEVWTANHNYDSEDLQTIPYDRRMVYKAVTIGENVWIGTHVLILPGAEIGEGAVIGAGTVVSGVIPPMAVVGGNPAKVIKYRDRETYERLKAEGTIYLDVEYDYDKSSLRKTEYLKNR
ncbi:MAG: acyltransferase [Ruminococcaceae bacterium]|nr:acyltransferase [Oscillospiraceae bacterium]